MEKNSAQEDLEIKKKRDYHQSTDTQRHCWHCQTYKDFSEFTKIFKNEDKLDKICKKCKAEVKKEWAEANPDKVADYNKYYRENNKEKRKIYEAKRRLNKKKV